MAKKRESNFRLHDAFIDICYDISPNMGNRNIEIMHIVTKNNLRSVKDYDLVISELVYPHLVEYDLLFNASNHNSKIKSVNWHDYHNRIKNFKNKLTRYFPSSINGYSQAIMKDIIKSVTYFYPYVAVSQGQVGEVVYFFTIVEYSSGEQEFKVSKTITGNNDKFAAENISKYVHNSLFNKTVHICSNNQIYALENSDTTNIDWITLFTSLSEIIMKYFGLDISKMNPRIVLSTRSKFNHFKKIQINVEDTIAIVEFNDSKNYHSHCCRSFKYLSEVEIIQKLLLSLKELINGSNIDETDETIELRKNQYIEYLIQKNKKYRMVFPESVNLRINEFFKKRNNEKGFIFLEAAFSAIMRKIFGM